MDGLGSGDADPVTLCLSKDPPPPLNCYITNIFAQPFLSLL